MNKLEVEGYLKPGKVFGPIYFVGTYFGSSHLIDTGDGLILLDVSFPENLRIVTENIKELGFDIKDIKIILISHGHYDHFGAAKQLRETTEAKIYVGEKDLKLVTGENDLALLGDLKNKEKYCFYPDVMIKDGDVINLGNVSIECLSTPGHTDGTMSFFFDVADGKTTYRVGMFGGARTNTLTAEFLMRFNLPFENRTKFLNSLEMLSSQEVEIFLGNHAVNNHTAEKLELVRNGEAKAFYAPNEWQFHLKERKDRLCEVINSDKLEH